jgi:hypothetical protein
MHAATSSGSWLRLAHWGLPVAGFILVAQGARARPLELPQIWTATLVLCVLTAAASAWLRIAK